MTTTPAHPKAYHIVHVDNLQSIISDNALLCDAAMAEHNKTVTTIGMSHIKAMRQKKAIACHPGLFVGGCVPFYFCPRSVMLYVIYMRNPELAYREGQGPIIHLEADLRQVVAWADAPDGAGPSPPPMRRRPTLRTTRTLSNSTRLIGAQSKLLSGRL